MTQSLRFGVRMPALMGMVEAEKEVIINGCSDYRRGQVCAAMLMNIR